jgi:hypothetical protein
MVPCSWVDPKILLLGSWILNYFPLFKNGHL